MHNNILRYALGAVSLLIIPLILQLTIGTGVDGQGFNWTLFDFVIMGVLLFVVGLAIGFVMQKVTAPRRRVLAIGAIVLIFLATWAHMAVGLFGESVEAPRVGATAEFAGIVTSVDQSQILFDGPYVVTIDADNYSLPVTIHVPSMGILLCAAHEAKQIGDVSLIKVGDDIEVRGKAAEDGSVVPCESTDHYLRLKPIVATDFEGEADPSRMTLGMKTWIWDSALYNDGRTVRPAQAGKFTLKFEDGRFTATTDCNHMGGTYTADAAKGTITFSDMFSTKMYCEGSQETVFSQLLRDTAGYHFTSKGELILDIKFDSGSVVFK